MAWKGEFMGGSDSLWHSFFDNIDVLVHFDQAFKHKIIGLPDEP
jgi:hypothetical protein